MFDFTEPSHTGRPSGRSCPYVAITACASIGSPSILPTPSSGASATTRAGEVTPAPPPASASVQSPDRSDWHARCSATSEDEHAVSTVTAGPSSPSVYDTRPETTLAAVPVTAKPSPSSGPPAPYPEYAAPANTPVRLPRNDPGSIPARSRASQHTSSSIRCCGCIASASRGLIPKNPASKSAASYTNPP